MGCSPYPRTNFKMESNYFDDIYFSSVLRMGRGSRRGRTNTKRDCNVGSTAERFNHTQRLSIWALQAPKYASQTNLTIFYQCARRGQGSRSKRGRTKAKRDCNVSPTTEHLSHTQGLSIQALQAPKFASQTNLIIFCQCAEKGAREQEGEDKGQKRL